MSDENTKPPVPKTKSGRGLKIALALSLGLNVAIIGLVAGAIIGRSSPGGATDAISLRALGLGPFIFSLDREDRTALRNRLEDMRPAIVGEGRDLGMAYRALQSALRADPFDRVAAEDALERTRHHVIGLQEGGHRALLDQIETMDLQERAALADRLDRPLRRVPPPRRDGRD